jgi:hypothetical protein
MEDLEIRIKVSKDGKRLETHDDRALYYFEPQIQDPLHDKIPWMDNMFPFTDWMKKWNPLVGTAVFAANDAYDLVAQKDFGYGTREGGPEDKGKQILFRNWYLYTYKPDEKGITNGEIAGLWKLVPADLKMLTGKMIGDQKFLGGP